MNEIDERKGAPSASNGGRYELCHGSHAAGAKFKSKGSPAATLGTSQHLIMTGVDVDLEDVALEDCKEAERQRDTIMDFVFPDRDSNPPKQILEVRMWYKNNRYSGVPDLLAMRDGRGLIVDYKFGRVKVPHAKGNVQLKWLSVLADRNHKLDKITVCIIQPRCGGFTSHTYDRSDLKRARRSVLYHLRLMESENLLLRPGKEQCRYCPANEACPALHSQARGIASINKVEALTPVQLSEAMDMVDAVESACKAIRRRAGEVLQTNPNAIPGYELVRGSSRRSISNAVEAFFLLRQAGLMTNVDFIEACSVGVGKLQKIVERVGQCGPKEAKEKLEEVLAGNIRIKEGEPKPCRVE